MATRITNEHSPQTSGRDNLHVSVFDREGVWPARQPNTWSRRMATETWRVCCNKAMIDSWCREPHDLRFLCKSQLDPELMATRINSEHSPQTSGRDNPHLSVFDRVLMDCRNRGNVRAHSPVQGRGYLAGKAAKYLVHKDGDANMEGLLHVLQHIDKLCSGCE
jgi:hypothetical protein